MTLENGNCIQSVKVSYFRGKSVGQLKFKVLTSLFHLIMKEPVCIVSLMMVVFDGK